MCYMCTCEDSEVKNGSFCRLSDYVIVLVATFIMTALLIGNGVGVSSR